MCCSFCWNKKSKPRQSDSYKIFWDDCIFHQLELWTRVREPRTNQTHITIKLTSTVAEDGYQRGVSKDQRSYHTPDMCGYYLRRHLLIHNISQLRTECLEHWRLASMCWTDDRCDGGGNRVLVRCWCEMVPVAVRTHRTLYVLVIIRSAVDYTISAKDQAKTLFIFPLFHYVLVVAVRMPNHKLKSIALIKYDLSSEFLMTMRYFISNHNQNIYTANDWLNT